MEEARETLAKKDFGRAVEFFEDALARGEGDRSEIKVLYARALRGQAQLLAAQDTHRAETLLRKAVEADPQNAPVYYDLGKLYTQSKDYSQAIRAYLKAADLNPGSANIFFNLGFTYAAIKNYVSAEKMFARATELHPPYLDKAIFNLAMVQLQQGKNQLCVANLKRALAVNPNNEKARKYLERFKGVSGDSP